MATRSEQYLMGLDFNATRLRVVAGPASGAPRPVIVDGTQEELALALSLLGRNPEVGKAGLALCRRSPHQCCLNFLPHLGTPRQWHADRHRLDAGQALALVLQRVAPA